MYNVYHVLQQLMRCRLILQKRRQFYGTVAFWIICFRNIKSVVCFRVCAGRYQFEGKDSCPAS